MTEGYLSGDFDEEGAESQERFGDRGKHAQQRKIEQTALLREAEKSADSEIGALPVGQVIQVFSLYAEVEHPDGNRLCVVRKTLQKLAESGIIVGDLVQFRDVAPGEAVIERVLPRKTVLTRTDSFHSDQQQPIVANADQMLIVASVLQPRVKWGLVDRMIVAGMAGGLAVTVCLNKVDLAAETDPALDEAEAVLSHYATMGIATLKTSVTGDRGLEELRESLKDRTTVLAGHSGVGKSSLISAIQPSLDLRIGAVSEQTDKGRHTTTGARRYRLDMGGFVVDTPGVKVFGLWNVSRETLAEYYPDVADGSAPAWRKASYERLVESLPV